MRSLESRIPPVVVGLLLGAAMAAAARLLPVAGFTLPAAHLIAAGFALAGIAVALSGVASFRRAGTTVNPLQPTAVSRLVVTGIYRRTRNPMYLGMLLALLGWGTFLAHPFALGLAVLFVPLMNRLQIRPEERVLAAKFGPDFTAYQSSTRRWL